MKKSSSKSKSKPRVSSKPRVRRRSTRCGYCEEPATKEVVWADGRAVVRVCRGHVELALNRIRLNRHPEIVSVRRLRG